MQTIMKNRRRQRARETAARRRTVIAFEFSPPSQLRLSSKNQYWLVIVLIASGLMATTLLVLYLYFRLLKNDTATSMPPVFEPTPPLPIPPRRGPLLIPFDQPLAPQQNDFVPIVSFVPHEIATATTTWISLAFQVADVVAPATSFVCPQAGYYWIGYELRWRLAQPDPQPTISLATRLYQDDQFVVPGSLVHTHYVPPSQLEREQTVAYSCLTPLTRGSSLAFQHLLIRFEDSDDDRLLSMNNDVRFGTADPMTVAVSGGRVTCIGPFVEQSFDAMLALNTTFEFVDAQVAPFANSDTWTQGIEVDSARTTFLTTQTGFYWINARAAVHRTESNGTNLPFRQMRATVGFPATPTQEGLETQQIQSDCAYTWLLRPLPTSRFRLTTILPETANIDGEIPQDNLMFGFVVPLILQSQIDVQLCSQRSRNVVRSQNMMVNALGPFFLMSQEATMSVTEVENAAIVDVLQLVALRLQIVEPQDALLVPWQEDPSFLPEERTWVRIRDGVWSPNPRSQAGYYLVSLDAVSWNVRPGSNAALWLFVNNCAVLRMPLPELPFFGPGSLLVPSYRFVWMRLNANDELDVRLHTEQGNQVYDLYWFVLGPFAIDDVETWGIL